MMADDDDYRGILNAIAAYSHAVDRGDWSIIHRAYDDQTQHVNADDVTVLGVDAFIEYRKHRETFQGKDVLHIPYNLLVDIDGDSATCLSNWTYLVKAPAVDRWDISAVGVYDDTFRRTDQGWRFATRKIHNFAKVDPRTWT